MSNHLILPKNKLGYILFLLPSLIASYLIAFFFNNNAHYVKFSMLVLPSLIVIASTLVMTLVVFLVLRNYIKAIIVCSIVALFFISYGIVFQVLKHLDRFQIEHYALLPSLIILILYLSFMVILARQDRFQTSLIAIPFSVMLLLVAYNLISGFAIQAKNNPSLSNTTPPETNDASILNEPYSPDVYYIVFDEMASTDVVRQTFQNNKNIDLFESNLQARDFYHFKNARSRTISTQLEMADRLNMKLYDKGLDRDYMVSQISNAAVFQIFSQHGYHTVIYPGYYYLLKNTFNPPEINVDLVLSYSSNDSQNLSLQFLKYEVIPMLLNYTMAAPFVSTSFERNSGYVNNWRNSTLFALNEIPQIPEKVPGPRFIYAHITSPHAPYVFTENGGMTDETCARSQYCYLGQYLFLTHQIPALIDKILAQYPADQHPIIIIQADHGMRVIHTEGWTTIPDYSSKNATHIFFALLYPGMDYQTIPENFDPINTFQFILNQLFGTSYPNVQ